MRHRRRLSLLALAPAWALLALAPVGRLRAESLLPVEAESFRAQYGQEALFRLRLGVDDALGRSAVVPGDASGAQVASPGPCPATSWQGSEPWRQFSQAVEQHRFFDAGKILGNWQRLKGSCP